MGTQLPPVPTERGTASLTHTLFRHVCCGPAVAHLSNCWALVKYLLLQGDTSGDYKRLLMGLVRGRWISVMSTICIKCPEEIIARVAAAAAAGCAVFIECVLLVEFSTLRLSDSEIVLLAFFSRSYYFSTILILFYVPTLCRSWSCNNSVISWLILSFVGPGGM